MRAPLMLRPMHRQQRQQQQPDAEQGERVAVALEVAGPAHDDERADEGGDAERRPERLEPGQVLVEAGDEHVADAVEEPGHREEHAVGVGRQLAGGDVGGGEQADDHPEERDDVRRQATRCGRGWPACTRRR